MGDAALNVLEDSGGVDWSPVIGNDVPVDWCKAEFSGDREHSGATGSVGRTEETDGSTEGVFEDSVTACQLLADAGSGLPGEPGMSHGVVADDMPGGGNLAGKSGLLVDEASNKEEGGADVRCGENVEKSGSGRGVRAIIICKGEFLGAWWSDENLAEKLRAGPEGGIS